MVAQPAGAPGRHRGPARGSIREVAAREADGEERSLLWARWEGVSKDLDAYATRRTNTPVVVLEPGPGRGA